MIGSLRIRELVVLGAAVGTGLAGTAVALGSRNSDAQFLADQRQPAEPPRRRCRAGRAQRSGPADRQGPRHAATCKAAGPRAASKSVVLRRALHLRRVRPDPGPRAETALTGALRRRRRERLVAASTFPERDEAPPDRSNGASNCSRAASDSAGEPRRRELLRAALEADAEGPRLLVVLAGDLVRVLVDREVLVTTVAVIRWTPIRNLAGLTRIWKCVPAFGLVRVLILLPSSLKTTFATFLTRDAGVECMETQPVGAATCATRNDPLTQDELVLGDRGARLTARRAARRACDDCRATAQHQCQGQERGDETRAAAPPRPRRARAGHGAALEFVELHPRRLVAAFTKTNLHFLVHHPLIRTRGANGH